MANEFAGSAAYLEFVHAGGTTVLSTDHRNISYDVTQESIDATAGADAYRQTIPSFSDASLTFEGLFPSNGTAVMQALKEGTLGTINYGPAGTATNSPKISFPARSGGASYATPFSDVAVISCQFMLYNGSVTYAAY